MMDHIMDRITDRIVSSVMDSLTYAGLFVIGLFERLRIILKSSVTGIKDYLNGLFSKGYIKSLLICIGSVSLLMLILAARLQLPGMAQSADIIKLVRVSNSAWSIVDNTETNISDNVMAYQSSVEKYAKQYDMEGYESLIYAVMQQESDGSSPDIMQSSTCLYNEEYPQVADGITDPDYSIKCGVQYLKYCLEQAGVTGPDDIRHMRLALQGYNYGHNYIEWALKRDGGYTRENAQAFAQLMMKSNGWESYGDTDYPDHVLRYYPQEYQQSEDS